MAVADFSVVEFGAYEGTSDISLNLEPMWVLIFICLEVGRPLNSTCLQNIRRCLIVSCGLVHS